MRTNSQTRYDDPAERSIIGPGLRCRATRAIVHPGGIVRRAAEGTVLTMRENIGRLLVTVDFGEVRLILFPHEFEPVAG